MNKVKAVSFDFWNTFVIPNPKYAEARTEYLHSNYGLEKEDYTKVKQHLDHYAETNGIATTPSVACSMLFPYPNFIGVDVYDVLYNFGVFFLETPPSFPGEIIESIQILENNNIPWGITSNTNFIGGAVIRDWLTSGWRKTLVSKNCYAMTFSDEFGYSKPNKIIFLETVAKLEKFSGHLELSEVLHIGDNTICDGLGAINAGLQFALIKTPKDILEIVKTL